MENQIVSSKNDNKNYVVFFALSIIIIGISSLISIAISPSHNILSGYNICGEAILCDYKNINRVVSEQYTAFNLSTENANKINNAEELQRLSNEITEYVLQLRIDLINYVDGTHEPSDITYIANSSIPYIPIEKIYLKENFDKPTYFLLYDDNNAPDNKCRATILKEKLDLYKDTIIKLVSQENREKVSQEIAFLRDSKPYYDDIYAREVNWETYHFYCCILSVAAIQLDVIISNIKSAELIILNNL